MTKTEKLLELHQKWAKDNTCTLRESATQPVFGDGSAEADIVFIGEAPGKDEDIKGIPFIGRAGRFLNEMLESINLDRQQVYITNTVKYRPPNNRDPKPAEIEACRQWLADELNLIQPAVIVTLGRYALNYFIPEAKISEAHGNVLKKDVNWLDTDIFFVMYHPAAALYNGSMREVLLADFAKLPNVVEQSRAGTL